MNPVVKGALIGMGIGAAVGTLPGFLSFLLGMFAFSLSARLHTQDASSLVVYLGLLIGGAAGAIVGAMVATSTEEAEDVEAEEEQPSAS